MLKSSSVFFKTTGFYVATHPWISAAGLVKVGYSKNLERRLESTPFVTCFTPEWRFHSVLACRSGRDALLLEQSVLFCLRDSRIPHRELLRVTAPQALRIAKAVAKLLNIHVEERADVQREGTRTESPVTTALAHSSADHGESSGTESAADLDAAAVIDPVIETLRTVPVRQLLAEGIPAPLSPSVSLTSEGQPHLWVENGLRCNGDEETEELSFLDTFALDSGSISSSAALIDNEEYAPVKLRAYQLEAVSRLETELLAHGKTICQMACRCGKTPVAYHLIQRLCWAQSKREGRGRVLYLVPGLTLLRQTARKLYGYGLPPRVPILLIGSDPHPVRLGDGEDASVIMTTDRQTIRQTVLSNPRLLVISTYHSSPLLAELNQFDLTVFDECHRVCGSCDETAFNTILRLPPSGPRLFLTATPTYDTPIRMNNQGLFGGIGYRYYLREGIDAGHVNPFSVRVVLTPNLDDMNPCLFEAMRRVNKMLVFCRNIQHAESLRSALNAAKRPADVAPFATFVAHSRMPAAEVAQALEHLVSGERCILFNVRLFQEGVEIPDLNAVFFAAPRYSSRDIIQSLCRPLNKTANKPPSLVFLPAVYNAKVSADHPINLESFATLVPFTDALMDEDPTLFEYMIDPDKVNYDLQVVGVRSMKLTTEELMNFVLPAVRRGVRYSSNQTDRLHRASRLPWKYVFAEMKRVVLECNRYPKTNDAWVVGDTCMSMSLFYRYARKGYQQYLDGGQTYLQTYQIRDLESLPEWKRYGLHGPYPWKECINTLERFLRVHGKPPLLDVHKGGYIGLDATPFERLAGCLMHVNQCDARTGLRLSPDKQKDLDKLAAEFRIRWRKPRDPKTGHLKKGASSFITKIYDTFKALYEQGEAKNPQFYRYVQKHFPGYPDKHNRMETMENLASGKVPPRHEPKVRRTRNGKRQSEAGTKDDMAGTVVSSPNAKRGRGRPPGSTKKHHGAAMPVAPRERKVMCRVCRTRVLVHEWELHVASDTHLRAQGAPTTVPMHRQSDGRDGRRGGSDEPRRMEWQL